MVIPILTCRLGHYWVTDPSPTTPTPHKNQVTSNHSLTLHANPRTVGGGTQVPTQVPTAKRPRGAEAVNAKIQGRSTPFGAKKGGGQLQTKIIIGALAYNVCLYPLYFIRYMAFSI